MRGRDVPRDLAARSCHRRVVCRNADGFTIGCMRAEIPIDPAIRLEKRSRGADVAIAELATRQHGRVARWQLLAIGLRNGAIDRRIATGGLHPEHRGVYAVGYRSRTREGRWMAAVLACGPAAVLSSWPAAAHWRMRDRAGGPVHVTVPRGRHARSGIVVHHARLPPDEITVHEGIPITTVPRTILDIAAAGDRRDVDRALKEAEFLRLADPLSLQDLVDRYPGRRGVRTVRQVLEAAALGLDITRSELEELFLALVAQYGLPRPRTNVMLEVGFEVDCVWPEHRLVVELDGHASHATRAGFERDRERDRVLQAAGWRVVRITWRQLHDDPERVARDLARLLR